MREGLLGPSIPIVTVDSEDEIARANDSTSAWAPPLGPGAAAASGWQPDAARWW